MKCCSEDMRLGQVLLVLAVVSSTLAKSANLYRYIPAKKHEQSSNSNIHSFSKLKGCPNRLRNAGCSCFGPFAIEDPKKFDPSYFDSVSGGAGGPGPDQSVTIVVQVTCTPTMGISSLDHVTSIMSTTKLPNSAFFGSENDFSFARTTTRFTYSNGVVSNIGSTVLSSLVNLHFLNLSSNKIVSIEPMAFKKLKYIEVIDLSHNLLRELDRDLFLDLKLLSRLVLKYNRLHTLPENIFHTNPKLLFLDILGNDWRCDDHLIWLDDWLNENSERQLVDGSYLVCANKSLKVPLRTGLRNVVIQKYIWQSSICGASDGKEGKQSRRKCFCRPENGFAIVDCKNRGLEKLPTDLPRGTRNVYMSGNRISTVEKSLLASDPWKDVHLLDLSNNSIGSITQIEGTKLLRNLGALDLSHNSLIHIPIHVLEQMSAIPVLKLSANPWRCDCNTIAFQKWLQEQHSRVKDWDNVRCSSKQGSHKNKAIYTLRKPMLCVKSKHKVHFLDILSILMATLIIAIVGKLLYDYFHQKRTGQLPTFSKIL